MILKEALVDKSEGKNGVVSLTGSAKKLDSALYNTAVVPLETVMTLVSGVCSGCQEKIRKLLADKVRFAAPPPTSREMPERMRAILERVAYDYEIPIDSILRGGNSRKLVQARREVAIEARRQGFTFPQIGAALGKHHSTIIYLVQQSHHI